jgi:hypothetical protein
LQWPPFRNFGGSFYTYQILLDLKVEPGMASAETEWTSSTDTVFDGTYRHLHRAAKDKARQP